MSTHTHQLLRECATERYENCCDEGYPLADADGRGGIFIFDLSCFLAFFVRGGSTKRVLSKLTLPQQGFVGQAAGPEVAPPTVLYGHHFSERRCVGSEIASSASRYGRLLRPVLYKVY